MKYTCSVCGTITSERQCPDHQRRPANQGWSRHRDTAAQKRFRVAVLLRDQHKCRRCGGTEDLRAAHWPIPLRAFAAGDEDAYHPRHGLTLCAACDKRLDPYAR